MNQKPPLDYAAPHLRPIGTRPSAAQISFRLGVAIIAVLSLLLASTYAVNNTGRGEGNLPSVLILASSWIAAVPASAYGIVLARRGYRQTFQRREAVAGLILNGIVL